MRNDIPSRNGFDEAARYWRNARELLARSKVEDDIYVDIKPVQEAFGTAWLAIDKAIKAALREKGLSGKQIPRSWEPLLAAAVRHLAVRNGRLIRMLTAAYQSIHLAGYYYGELRYASSAKGAMEAARRVIEVLSGKKVG